MLRLVYRPLTIPLSQPHTVTCVSMLAGGVLCCSLNAAAPPNYCRFSWENPCLNNGFCTGDLNFQTWQCNCVKDAWDGLLCDVPICGIKAGGTRKAGDPYVDPGLMPDPFGGPPITQWVSHSLKGTAGGENITFRAGIGKVIDYDDPDYTINPASLRVEYFNYWIGTVLCTNPSAVIADPINFVYDVTCTMPEGVGGDGFLMLAVNGQPCNRPDPYVADRVSYGRPIFKPATLRPEFYRNNISAYLSPGAVVSVTAFGDLISFDVENMPTPNTLALLRGLQNVVWIYYGNATGDFGLFQYNCEFRPLLSTLNTLTCKTTAGGAGDSLQFAFFMAGQQATVVPDYYSYPVSPVIRAVQGCAVNVGGVRTRECPSGYVCSCMIRIRWCARPCRLVVPQLLDVCVLVSPVSAPIHPPLDIMQWRYYHHHLRREFHLHRRSSDHILGRW